MAKMAMPRQGILPVLLHGQDGHTTAN